MKSNTRFIFLDYLRVFAFSSVLLGHKFQATIQSFASDESFHVILRRIISFLSIFTENGGAGVVVFFLISGYIITYAIQREDALSFLVKRFFRIYPLYVSAVLIELLLQRIVYSGGEIDFRSLLVSLTLTGDIFNSPYTLAGVEWTLRLEVMFYLVVFIAKITGLIEKKILACGCMVLLSLLFIAYPIPNWDGWSRGYTGLYLPFLFMGVCVRFYEEKYISKKSAILVFSALYCLYIGSLPYVNPSLKDSYFTLAAVVLFLMTWRYRIFLVDSKIILNISMLTYSVYLFHNWLWFYIYNLASTVLYIPWLRSLLTLILLLLICKFFESTIEAFSNKVGKKVVSKMTGIKSVA